MNKSGASDFYILAFVLVTLTDPISLLLLFPNYSCGFVPVSFFKNKFKSAHIFCTNMLLSCAFPLDGKGCKIPSGSGG